MLNTCLDLGLPGVASVRHRVDTGTPRRGDQCLPLQVDRSHRGDLVFDLSDPVAFAPYEPYRNNVVFMVAVVIEERHQRRVIRQHQDELEQRVQDRTRELTAESSARQVVAEELRHRRNVLAQTLDSVPQAIYWKDRQSVYLGCNQVFARAVGIARPEEIVGKTDFDLPWSHEEAEKYRADDREVIEHARPKRHIVEPLQQSDGRRLWVDTTKVPLVDTAGNVSGVLGVFDDITERLQSESEKERLQTQLQHAQKIDSVGRLAGGVAHDFNNMLQTILGNVSLALADTAPDCTARENLQEIERAAQRSAELTRQLLVFARKQAASPRVIDLNDAVSNLLKMLHRLIGEDIRLDWKPGAGLWPVRIDPMQVDQILVNLTVNARDAGDGKGGITIETCNCVLDATHPPLLPPALPGDYVALTIADTGRGMDAEIQTHLFEPFFTPKEVGKGTGLGLATVYGIVQQNHSHIAVHSAPAPFRWGGCVGRPLRFVAAHSWCAPLTIGVFLDNS